MRAFSVAAFPVLSLLLAGLSPGAIASPVEAGTSSLPSLIWDEAPQEGVKRLDELVGKGKGLRVLWWNIMFGGMTPDFEAKYGKSLLDENLRRIVESVARPDVLALGECSPVALADETVELLERAYSFYDYYPYSGESPDRGLCVYSAHPTRESPGRELDWAPNRLEDGVAKTLFRENWRARSADAALEAKYFTRTYKTFRVDYRGRKIAVIPFHSLQPWDEIGRSSPAGKLQVVGSIVNGTENPLVFQFRRLIEEMQRDFGADLGDEPLVLIGDFNVPKSIVLEANAYSLLKRHLDEAFTGEPFTFPAASDFHRSRLPYSRWQLKIDHAFLSKKARAKAAAVLPLSGSDHYPIYVLVDEKAE